MVIHIDGTTAPGTPSAPEYLKAQVYLPPSTVVAELPNAHNSIAEMVQSFIENVGVPTKARWERVGRSYFGWSLKAPKSSRVFPPLLRFSTPIPPSAFGNSIYIFHGHSKSQPAASPSQPASTTSKAHKSQSAATLARALSPTHMPDDSYAKDNSAPSKTHKARGKVRAFSRKDSFDSDEMYVDNPVTNTSTVPDTFTDVVTESDLDYEDEISSSFLAAVNATEWALERRSFEEREMAYLRQIAELEENIARLQDQLSSVQRTQTPQTHGTPLLLSPFPPTNQPSTPVPSPASPSSYNDAIAVGFAPRPAQLTRVPVSRSLTPRETAKKILTPKGKSGTLATSSKKRDSPLFFSDMIKVTSICSLCVSLY